MVEFWAVIVAVRPAGYLQSTIRKKENSSAKILPSCRRCSFLVSLFFSTPIGEWPSPPPTLCRTCRMPLSTATMTAAWRSQKLRAASHRLVHALGPWPCLRTTMREPLQMEALERPSTLKMVRWHPHPWSVMLPMNMYLNVNDSDTLSLCECFVAGAGDILWEICLCSVAILQWRCCGNRAVDLLCLTMTVWDVIGF